MAQARRQLTAFSLSFLDIMSCGFGAVVLLFLIIKHNIDSNVMQPVPRPDLSAEVMLLEEEILDGKENLVMLKNTISDTDDELAEAQGLARRIMEEIGTLEGVSDELVDNGREGTIEKLKADIKRLETEKQQLLTEVTQSGEDSRRFAGDGRRAYVTGLQLGGKRLLILLDVSGSMLDDTIVNVIRRRNMRDARKRTAPKWIRARKITEWLAAKFPRGSQFQIYAFNTQTRATTPGTEGKWLNVSNSLHLEQALKNIADIVPEKGTNLEKAFIAAGRLRPVPDNIYLITDSLPTQGSRAIRGATITGNQRLKLLAQAIKTLPKGTAVNVILSPMEGDPEAANAFWRLSQSTGGSFMSPAKDWP